MIQYVRMPLLVIIRYFSQRRFTSFITLTLVVKWDAWLAYQSVVGTICQKFITVFLTTVTNSFHLQLDNRQKNCSKITFNTKKGKSNGFITIIIKSFWQEILCLVTLRKCLFVFAVALQRYPAGFNSLKSVNARQFAWNWQIFCLLLH